ncbi:TPA_asm: S2H [Powellomyces chytrid fungus MELD virus 2]|nr:TPA_asm: S2H [Powellomyces chytrid fungus MELD virus 2]
MLWCKGAGISFDEFWSWCRRKDSSTSRYKKHLYAWNNSEKYSVGRNFMDALLQRYYPEINVSPSTHRFYKQFDIAKTKHSIVVEEPYLSHDDMSSVKFSVLALPMGRNKTGAVVDFIVKNCKDLRVLWITPRITLSENTMWRLRSAGLKVNNYRDFSKGQKERGALDKCKVLICSIQSLHYTTDPFDLLVIDEPETVFSTFLGNATTHRDNLTENWNVLLGHIQTAKKAIFMDAFTTNLSVNFIKGIIRQTDKHLSDHYEVINTKQVANPRQFLEMETFDAWVTHIMQAAEKGQKLYIFTPYKNGLKGVAAVTKTLQKLMNWEENKHIFAYYAEKEEEKKKLCDAESIWGNEQCRCVVTNGTISVGVNFDAKNIFDKIYGFYAPFIPVRDFIQSMYRVRHPKSTAMILYREKTRTFGFEKRVLNYPNCPIFRQMQSDLQIELNVNDNTKNWETFNMICNIANITIYPVQLSTAHVNNQRYLECHANMAELAFDWNNIVDIDNIRAAALRIKTYNTTATLDDRLQLEKYFFKSKFDNSAPEEEMATVWKQKKDFIDKISQLCWQARDAVGLCPNVDYIIQVFQDNLVHLGDEFPKTMVNRISMDDIRKTFHFDRPIKNSQTGVVSQMLNAFFGMKVYLCKKKEQKDKERKYIYETNKLYLELAEICLEHRRKCESKSNGGGRHDRRPNHSTLPNVTLKDEPLCPTSVCNDAMNTDMSIAVENPYMCLSCKKAYDFVPVRECSCEGGSYARAASSTAPHQVLII